jgi:hypothetical protein
MPHPHCPPRYCICFFCTRTTSSPNVLSVSSASASFKLSYFFVVQTPTSKWRMLCWAFSCSSSVSWDSSYHPGVSCTFTYNVDCVVVFQSGTQYSGVEDGRVVVHEFNAQECDSWAYPCRILVCWYLVNHHLSFIEDRDAETAVMVLSSRCSISVTVCGSLTFGRLLCTWMCISPWSGFSPWTIVATTGLH